MLEQSIKHLNREFSSLERKLNPLRDELKEVQEALSTDLFNNQLIIEENNLLIHIEKWEGVHEQVLSKKSRATWVQAGDSNSKFFHDQMKARQSRNRIAYICNEQGVRPTKPKIVEREFVHFFQDLLGNCVDELPCLDVNIVRLGPCLNKKQQQGILQ